MSDLIGFLESINRTKVDVFATSEDPVSLEKSYPRYMINRMLVQNLECVFQVAEINQRGLAEYGLTNREIYDFLLHSIPRGKRYNKAPKPNTNDKIEFLVKVLNISIPKARELADIMSDADFENEKSRLDPGGLTRSKHGAKSGKNIQ